MIMRSLRVLFYFALGIIFCWSVFWLSANAASAVYTIYEVTPAYGFLTATPNSWTVPSSTDVRLVGSAAVLGQYLDSVTLQDCPFTGLQWDISHLADSKNKLDGYGESWMIWDFSDLNVNVNEVDVMQPETGFGFVAECDNPEFFYRTDEYGNRVYKLFSETAYAPADNETEFEHILKNKMPFVYFYQMRDVVEALTATTTTGTLDDMSIVVPSNAFGGINTTTLTVFDSDIFFSMAPQSVWNILRASLTAFMWIGLAFYFYSRLKGLWHGGDSGGEE